MDTSHSSIVESSSERSPKETKPSSAPTKTASLKYANKKEKFVTKTESFCYMFYFIVQKTVFHAFLNLKTH